MVEPSFRLNVSLNSSLFLRWAKVLRALWLLSSIVAVSLLTPGLRAQAQENRETKPNNKAVMWTNAINVGTSFLNASAEHYGARQCLNEGDTRVDALHGRFQRTLAISLPIDAALGFASWKLRRKHPGLALWLPATSAGMQTGFATIQYTQGCF